MDSRFVISALPYFLAPWAKMARLSLGGLLFVGAVLADETPTTPAPGLYSPSFTFRGAPELPLTSLTILLKSLKYEETTKAPEKAGQFSVSSRDLRVITNEFIDESGEFFPKMNLRYSSGNGTIENSLGEAPDVIRLEPLLLSSLEESKADPNLAAFLSAVKAELPAELQKSEVKNLRVFTHLIPEAQRCALSAVNKKGGAESRAIVAVDVKTRTVQAWAESAQAAGKKSFVTEERDASSITKPFVFLAAVDETLSGNISLGPLSPLEEPKPADVEAISLEIPSPGTNPKNRTIREAVELLTDADVQAFIARIGQAKADSILESFDIKNASLLKVTSAYASLASGGKHQKARLFAAVIDAQGKPISIPAPETKNIANPVSSFLLTDMLRGAINHGTGRKIREANYQRDVAGSLGEQPGGKSAWLVAYTPSLAIGVWTGDAKGLATEADAANTWTDFMRCVDGLLPPESFKPPIGVQYFQVDRTSFRPASQQCPRDAIEWMALPAARSLPPVCESHSRYQQRRDNRSRPAYREDSYNPWPNPTPQKIPSRQPARRRGNSMQEVWNDLRRGANNLWR